MADVDEILYLLSQLTEEERRRVFGSLRAQHLIHPIEEKLNAKAELILEAIDRAGDLTLRGIRGVIAEASFKINVVNRLSHWIDITPAGNFPFDFLLQDSLGQVRVQVKMQRLKGHLPMMANMGYKHLPSNMYVVETQRTRGGRDPRTREDTRPYRFGEFDILAVSLHPSSNDWSLFMYTVADWLLPRSDNLRLILKFQPVAVQPNAEWTDNLEVCVAWLRSGLKKEIL